MTRQEIITKYATSELLAELRRRYEELLPNIREGFDIPLKEGETVEKLTEDVAWQGAVLEATDGLSLDLNEKLHLTFYLMRQRSK